MIFQSTLLAGFALWMVSRIHPAPGMLTLLFVIGAIPAAAAFTNQTPLLAITSAQSLLTGTFADAFVARYDPHPAAGYLRPFRWFGALLPMTYIGIYLLGTALTGGIWWDWNVALGSWIWSGVCGFALSLVAVARRTG